MTKRLLMLAFYAVSAMSASACYRPYYRDDHPREDARIHHDEEQLHHDERHY